MTSPEFSILVPTRNRSEQIAATLIPLAHQKHRDYEIVVSDNSDEEHASRNAAVVGALKDKADIRIVRPDRVLNMLEHWNFALGTLRGTYVGVVTDRMTLLPSALATMRSPLAGGQPCVSFSHTTLRHEGGTPVLTPALSPLTAETMNGHEILQLFARGAATKACPRLLNSFVHSDVLARMKDELGVPLLGIAPDYSFLFNYLARYTTYLHLHRQFLVDHAPQVSNGAAASQNKPNRASKDFNERMRREQRDTMALRPMPNDTTFFANIILSEYLLAARSRPDADMPELDHAGIFAACWAQAKKIATLGDAVTDQALADLEQYRMAHALPEPSLFDRWGMALVKRRNLARRNRATGPLTNGEPAAFSLDRELTRGHEVLAALQRLDA